MSAYIVALDVAKRVGELARAARLAQRHAGLNRAGLQAGRAARAGRLAGQRLVEAVVAGLAARLARLVVVLAHACNFEVKSSIQHQLVTLKSIEAIEMVESRQEDGGCDSPQSAHSLRPKNGVAAPRGHGLH